MKGGDKVKPIKKKKYSKQYLLELEYLADDYDDRICSLSFEQKLNLDNPFVLDEETLTEVLDCINLNCSLPYEQKFESNIW